jgi:hypothetical protein
LLGQGSNVNPSARWHGNAQPYLIAACQFMIASGISAVSRLSDQVLLQLRVLDEDDRARARRFSSPSPSVARSRWRSTRGWTAFPMRVVVCGPSILLWASVGWGGTVDWIFVSYGGFIRRSHIAIAPAGTTYLPACRILRSRRISVEETHYAWTLTGPFVCSVGTRTLSGQSHCMPLR